MNRAQGTARPNPGAATLHRRAALTFAALLILAASAKPSADEPVPPREVSATLLKELIARDEPAIVGEDDPWRKSSLLRSWTHANVRWASHSAKMDNDPALDFYRREAPWLFAAFMRNKGGVWCGGAAYSLRKLYELFGLEAHTVGMGDAGGISHVVTLVRVECDGEPMLAIQDPTFDLAYVDGEGSPYDYFDLLAALGNREDDAIHVLSGNADGSLFLLHEDDDKSGYPQYVDPDSPAVSQPREGLELHRSHLSLESFEERFQDDIAGFLEGQGLPQEPIYLFLTPLDASEPWLLEAAQEAAAAAADSQ